MRLRTDHQLAIVAARRLLPPRPLPGERGFTGVPPVGENAVVSTEMVFRLGPNVSRQALDAAAQRLGLTVISSQDFGITGGLSIISVLPAAGRLPMSFGPWRRRTSASPAELHLSAVPGGGACRQIGDRLVDQYVVSKLRLDEVHQIAKAPTSSSR